MPLLKSKHNNNNNDNVTHSNMNQNPTSDAYSGAGTGAGMGTGPTSHFQSQGNAQGMGMGGTGAPNSTQPQYEAGMGQPYPNQGHTGHHPGGGMTGGLGGAGGAGPLHVGQMNPTPMQGQGQPIHDQQHAQGGMGMNTGGASAPFSDHQGQGYGQGHGQGQGQGGLPPTSTLSGASTGKNHGSGHKLTGKVEQAIGTMVGSNALKAKGLQKQQEAQSFQQQGLELAEAERLEQEALARRERAVGHGAHPANKHLGAGMGTSNPN